MKQIFLLTRAVDIVTTIVEVFLIVRLLLKLFGASEASPFVTWMYHTTAPLLAPFEHIFPTSVFQGQFVLEFSTLFAIIIYGVAGWLINELIYFVGDTVRDGRLSSRKNNNV